MDRLRNKTALTLLVVTMAFAVMLTPLPAGNASDHADAPINANDQGIDQGDTYAFLDPNDNSRLILALTVRGFIVPGEAVNLAFFDPGVRYRFELDLNLDARPDNFIDVNFTPRTSPTAPQQATIMLPFGQVFTAPTTVPTLAGTPNPFTITTDSATGVQFFAGEIDDPFFFDIPAFSRLRASILAGSPDLSVLQRGRDTFAGYNILAIVFSIPVSYLRLGPSAGNPTGTVLGVDSLTQRQRRLTALRGAPFVGSGGFVTLDRSGNPGLNSLVIPFLRKDEYNSATLLDDANGRFAGDIVATLKALGTNDTNIGILASVYVAKGDALHLDTSVPNSGPGGGNRTGAGFPNGRRPADDVVDLFLFLVSNGGITTGDNVNANDVPFTNTFPFFAPPQQPRASGVDDNTRN
jgi:Domain of unknown function (DUF4331)